MVDQRFVIWVATLLVFAATIAVAVRLALKRRDVGMGRRAGLLMLLGALSIFLGWTSWGAYVRSVCGATALADSARLKRIHLNALDRLGREEPLPPRMGLLFEGEVLDNPPRWPCEYLGFDDYTVVGDWSVADLRDGRISRQELVRLASTNPAEGDWERVGPYLLSRERDALESFDERVVVGITLGRPRGSGDATNVVFADNHVARSEWGGGWIEADRAAREELGLSAPPDWMAHRERFLDQFGD